MAARATADALSANLRGEIANPVGDALAETPKNRAASDGTSIAASCCVNFCLLRTAVLALCLGAACGRTPEVAASIPRDCSNLACRPTGTIAWTATLGARPIDILILLDETVPAGPAGGPLAAAMQAMAASLQAQLDVTRYQADIHVALVPSNLGAAATATSLWPMSQACPLDDGAYLHTSTLCDFPANFTTPLPEVLGCASTHLPISGQPSRPMETIRSLFASGGLAQTTGFRRPEATLYLAIVAATDDPALATDAARREYRDFLWQLPAEAGNLEVVVVAPADAPGLWGLTGISPLYAEFDDLAAPSWDSMSWLAEPAQVDGLGFCIDFPYLDLGSPATGPRPVCNVSELATSPGGSSRERVIATCSEASTTSDALDLPCWRPVKDNNRCPRLGIRIDIRQPPANCRAPDRLRYWASCVVAYTDVEIPGAPSNPPAACGTEDDPATLTITERVPAPGATVKNGNITEAFTVKQPFSYLGLGPYDIRTLAPRHTAGYAVEVATQWTASDSGKNERDERTGVAWSAAPGHVELSAAIGWRTDTGCYFKLPSPLLSYDVVP